jgi:hypothetical protein
MAKVFLTYAHIDNVNQDVDFVDQELTSAGVVVRRDRWDIGAGVRLWDRIDKLIRDPAECDAWAIYLSQASLTREGCKEELAYALDRALSDRGKGFPLIGIANTPIPHDLVPGALASRLYVEMTDPSWKERIKAAAEGRAPTLPRPTIDPYTFRHLDHGSGYHMLEIRPRVGVWSPPFVAVPIAEKDVIQQVQLGPPGLDATPGGMSSQRADPSSDGSLWMIVEHAGAASATNSIYVTLRGIPTTVYFGTNNGPSYSRTPRR